MVHVGRGPARCGLCKAQICAAPRRPVSAGSLSAALGEYQRQFLLYHSQTLRKRAKLVPAIAARERLERLPNRFSIAATKGGAATIWIFLLILIGIFAPVFSVIRWP